MFVHLLFESFCVLVRVRLMHNTYSMRDKNNISDDSLLTYMHQLVPTGMYVCGVCQILSFKLLIVLEY